MRFGAIQSFHLFCMLVSALMVHEVVPADTSQKSPELERLCVQRSAGLIILNDTSENYAQHDIFPSLLISDIYQKNVMIDDMMSVFASDQPLLCTKTLWYQLQFLAKMWEDFATLDREDLLVKYLELLFFEPKIEAEIDTYRTIIREFDAIYKKGYQFHSQKPHRAELVTKKYDFSTIKKVCFFRCAYEAYHYAALQRNYQCYDVNAWYFLFVPHKLCSSYNVPSYPVQAFISDPHATWVGMISGLNLTLPRSQEYRQDLSAEQQVLMMQNCPLAERLGAYAIDAVSKVLINKHTINPQFAEFAGCLLPTMHIFMLGHGSIKDVLLGINIDDCSKLLSALNHRGRIGSVSLASCYLGGYNFQRFSSLVAEEEAKLERNALIEQLQFPIIFASSVYAPMRKYPVFTDKIFRFDELRKAAKFTRFFDALTKQEPGSDLPPPYYLKALNAIFNMLHQNGLTHSYDLSQQISIKFPRLPLIHAYDYDKRIQSIGPIGSSYKDTISVTKGVRLVLLKTDTILPPVEITQQVDMRKPLDEGHELLWVTFLPLNYQWSHYHFKKIIIPHVKNLYKDGLIENILEILDHLFFKVALGPVKIGEPINIMIDDLQINDVYLSNVVLFVDKGEGFFETNLNRTPKKRQYVFKRETGQAWKFQQNNGHLSAEDNNILQKAIAFKDSMKDNLTTSKQFQQRSFQEKLRKTLKNTRDNLPQKVQESRASYEHMTLDQRAANVTTKKDARGLNPYAKPFVPTA